jgi:hypothetical protein
LIGLWERGSSAAAGAFARYRERLREQERIREARIAEANRHAAVRPSRPRPPPDQSNLRPQRNRPPAELPEPVAGGPGEGGA